METNSNDKNDFQWRNLCLSLLPNSWETVSCITATGEKQLIKKSLEGKKKKLYSIWASIMQELVWSVCSALSRAHLHNSALQLFLLSSHHQSKHTISYENSAKIQIKVSLVHEKGRKHPFNVTCKAKLLLCQSEKKMCTARFYRVTKKDIKLKVTRSTDAGVLSGKKDEGQLVTGQFRDYSCGAESFFLSG